MIKRKYIKQIFYPIHYLLVGFVINIFCFLKLKQMNRAKEWQHTLSSDPFFSINSLFYSRIERILGISGFGSTSSYVGLGNFNTNRWAHIPIFSIKAYVTLGALLGPLCMLFFLGGHIFVSDMINAFSLEKGIVIFLILSSSTFYAMSFARQNYQVCGWMLFPFALYFMHTNMYILSAFLLLASFLSLTALLFLSIIFSLIILYNADFINILVFIPALLKVILVEGRLYMSGNSFAFLLRIFKPKGSLKRTYKINPFKIYQFLLIVLFYGVFSWYNRDSLTLPLAVVALFLVNEFVLKLADIESVMITNMSVSTYLMLDNNNQLNYFILAAYWLLVSPHVLLFGLRNFKILVPFNSSPLLRLLKDKIGELCEDDKVLLFTRTPSRYEDVYHGNRLWIEPLSYICVTQKVHFIPDWWACFETASFLDEKIYVDNAADAAAFISRLKPARILIFNNEYKDSDVNDYLNNFYVLESEISNDEVFATGYTYETGGEQLLLKVYKNV